MKVQYSFLTPYFFCTWYPSTFGTKYLKTQAEFDGTDGLGGRSRKVSFKFLQTLCAFRTYVYILEYEIKIITNILMGFKIWCQVGGGGINFLKLPYVRNSSNIWFQKLTDIKCKRSLELGNLYWTFNLQTVFCLFETLKMFYYAGSSKLLYIRVFFLKKHTKSMDFR